MVYKPKNFRLQELVPKVYYEYFIKRYSEDYLWQIFDYRALVLIQQIRDYFGVAFLINNWHVGGDLQFRGFRPFEYFADMNNIGENCFELKPVVGAYLSQHRFARAFDMTPMSRYTVEEVRQVLIEKRTKEGRFPFLGGIELNVSWLHVDARNTSKLVMFSKK